MYNDVKQQIDSIIPDASHSLLALVTLYQDCDDQFNKLINEKSELAENKELSISASMLFDAYELVEDVMNTMGMLIVNVGKDEQQGINQYVDVSTLIEPAKELMPELMSMIHTVSSQMSDFIELHRSLVYTDINMLNPMKVQNYMDVNRKVSRISTIIHTQMVNTHSDLITQMSIISDHLTQSSMVMEASESIKGNYYVSIIDNLSIVEVGVSEKDVRTKTREYFNGELDDSIEILPCSTGVYDKVVNDGEIPETWDVIDGVVVLPEEKSLYESVELMSEAKNGNKAATVKVHYDIEEKVLGSFSGKVIKVTGEHVGDAYIIKIHPDTVIEKNKFGGDDKRIVLDIYRKLQKHEWFDSVKLGEDSDGVITLTLKFSDIDFTNNGSSSIIESFSLSEGTDVKHAGFIPYYINDDGEVFMMTMIPSDPEYGGSEPQMAKGRIDPGHDAKSTAHKEAQEEVGLKPNNLKSIEFLGVMTTNKPIAIYYGEVKDINDFSEPHYETGWSGWINITKNLKMIRGEQRHVFSKLLDILS